MNQKRFMASLQKRFSLRLHMTLILLATAMAGVLACKGMLAVGLHNMALRYPITVLFAYLVFFGAIKIWLWFMTNAPASAGPDRNSRILDGIDILLPSSGGGSETAAFAEGDGGSGGAGASADFSDSGAASSGVGDAVGAVVGGAVEDEGGLVLVILLGLLAALLFSVLGAGIFLIWEAPAILAEAVFNTVLAAGLVRSTKCMNKSDWQGSIFKTTWKPFTVVLAFALLAGWAMHHYLPKASRMIDVIKMVE